MAEVKDPVCGKTVDTSAAAGKESHQSKDYYFCSDGCRREFRRDPAHYTELALKDDPPYTVTEHMAAPRFGSAGSGGLENEPPRPIRR
jgi:YHS domain-containing protein